MRYALTRRANFLIVSSEAEHYVENLARFLENALCTIIKTLDGIAAPWRYGKQVVILFDKTRDFFRYISDYYPEEGKFASPAGIFLDRGLGHFVLPQADIREAEQVVAHELCHACVAHLHLPTWLDEGIAEIMEDAISGRNYVDPYDLIMDRHRTFWREEEIQQFWSGESFGRPDEGQELSYHLARLATGALSHDYAAFKRFVLSANRKDAGEAAVEEVYGGSLGDLMEQLLGSGNWEPAPEKWTYNGDHNSAA